MALQLCPPLKWHGGKSYLAKRIVALMPTRCNNPNKPDPDDPGYLHYVEPYAGGLAVLLENDPEGISEVVNDLNKHITNFWLTLQSGFAFNRFQRLCEATPCSKYEYERAIEYLEEHGELKSHSGDRWTHAHAFFVACRQSRAATFKGLTDLAKTRTRRGMNELPSAWLTAIEGLPAVHARLKRVVILNDDALDVIREQDGKRTLYYLDPPYLHETRATVGQYEHEMTEAQHHLLLAVLKDIQGRFLLSGYHSDMYDSRAEMNGWNCHEFKISNHASGGKKKRRMIECVWANF